MLSPRGKIKKFKPPLDKFLNTPLVTGYIFFKLITKRLHFHFKVPLLRLEIRIRTIEEGVFFYFIKALNFSTFRDKYNQFPVKVEVMPFACIVDKC